MTQHTAEVLWVRGDQNFFDHKYSRKHVLRFDGGAEVQGSSSPHVVPIPFSDTAAVDPEEAFISALSSCHMLWFLDIAARRGFRVDQYSDSAVGIMGKNPAGKWFISVVTLRPDVRYSGDKIPTHAEITHMHHQAHEECFIANSVKTEVHCEPV